jgi:23S rRNA G2445 N2-methylase RlmL
VRDRRRRPCFVTCAPGIEPLLHAELKALRLARVERQVGGVYFEGTRRDALRANLELRTAVRVLERITRFEARDADELHEGALRVDWTEYLREGGSLRVDAHTGESSALDHSLFVEQRVKDAVCDQLRGVGRSRPDVDKEDPDLRIVVHLHRDRCTLLLDTSGESLHRRGWRRHQGRAPLAENLAAALVLLSGWDRRAPVVDPFCGSGTLLVEAALLADGVAPGLFRERFALEAVPGFEPAVLERLRAEARARIRPAGKLQLVGSELSAERVAEAGENLAAAGLAERARLEVADAAELELRAGWNGLVLTNPPYGERVGEEGDLRPLYRALGARLRERGAGYSLALFSGNPALERELGIPFHEEVELRNGGLECRLLLARLGAPA